MNVYESEKLLNEYLLFHYGTAEEIAPPPMAASALNFSVRCVAECIDRESLPDQARALDLGCAVGRSSFELAKSCASVVGIDFSSRFIETACSLREKGAVVYARIDEGELTTTLVARVPSGVDRSRVVFEVGDAIQPRPDLDGFDVVLMANLIDRLPDPRRCLAHLSRLVKSGGQLVITSPYTWLAEFTPTRHWLGGSQRDGRATATLDGLEEALAADFRLTGTKDLPFLIREHARKFQLSVAQASLWRRR
jgi:putative 4-mercaptohistidine N1-methyltranferase